MILLALVFLGPLLGVNVINWIMGPPLTNLYMLLLGGLF
jgi:hypothetical protein